PLRVAAAGVIQDRRPWSHQLRLLPGGEADVASAVIGTSVLAFILWWFGFTLALALQSSLPGGGGFPAFGLACAFPCAVVAAWVVVRVHRTQPISLEDAAAWPERGKVYFGDELPRVPTPARIIPLRPRRVTLRLIDGRPFVLTFRANDDPDDLLALARAL